MSIITRNHLFTSSVQSASPLKPTLALAPTPIRCLLSEIALECEIVETKTRVETAL